MGYIYIAFTILFTVYGQLIIKWRMSLKGTLPEGLVETIKFVLVAYTDLWIMSAFASAFLASMTWAAAMTKFELSFAYPFTSLSFVIVFILSILLFGEGYNWGKILGLAFIIFGVILTAKFS